MESSNFIQKKPDVAIVICAYNPEERIFSRLLNAVKSLIIPDNLAIEHVIVDNNSTPPIVEYPYVSNFLKDLPSAKVVNETKQGLSYARITGVNVTQAPIIIFFDDDNEPDEYYLKAVKYSFQNYPSVGIWGPGKVSVDFVDPVLDWFASNFRSNFQETNCQHIEYGCVIAAWPDFYPPGTGLALKREIFEKYIQKFQSGELTSLGRNGNSLASGEDIQIVWEAVKMGFAAGKMPEMKLKHIIPGKRANLHYIKRLNFGASSSYMPALIQCFPTEKDKAWSMISSSVKVLINIMRIILIRLVSTKYDLTQKYHLVLLDLAGYFGLLLGSKRAIGSNKIWWVDKIVRALKFE